MSQKPNYEGADHFFWRTIAKDSIDNEMLTAIYTGMDTGGLNPVIRSHLIKNKIPQVIDQVKAFYASKKANWSWCLTDRDNPKELPKYLENSGLKLLEQTPKMCLKLDKTNFDQTKIAVKEILSVQQFSDWAVAIREGFEAKDDSFAHFLSLLPFGPGKHLRHYIAYHDDQPASSGTLSLSCYGARIDNMATADRFRRKGFGTAVLLRALSDAKQAGVRYCYLDSSKEGIGLYSSLGFTEIGNQLMYGFDKSAP